MKNGDFVKIEYVGRLESGEIFDLTDVELAKKENIFNPRAKYGPVTIIVGAGFVIPGLDKALETMNVGEHREVIVKAEDGFGQRQAGLVRTVPSKMFKNLPVPGQIVDFGNVRGRVQSVNAGRVRIDFNHPLAGKTLKYEVSVKEKVEGHRQQIESILEFFGIKPDVKIDGKVASIHAKLPPQLKEHVSKLILEHVKGLEKIDFVESFSKQDKKSEPEKS